MIRLVILTVILIVVIAIPVYAQQAGLTLEGLSSRIDVLFSGQQYLLNRIAALETAVAISSLPQTQQQAVTLPTMTPTPLPPPPPPTPSATPTLEPTATLTPVPAQARAVVGRRSKLRRGPGSFHAVVATVDVGEELKVVGKDLNGIWWKVEYENSSAWISTTYVDAFDTAKVQIVATPTPLPSPSPLPTETPLPTATPEQTSDELWELIKTSVKNDIEGSGGDPATYTTQGIEILAGERIAVLREASELCDLSDEELIEAIETHALPIDESGISAEQEFWMRWIFMSTLSEIADTYEVSCDWHLKGYRDWLLEKYSHEEEETE